MEHRVVEIVCTGVTAVVCVAGPAGTEALAALARLLPRPHCHAPARLARLGEAVLQDGGGPSTSLPRPPPDDLQSLPAPLLHLLPADHLQHPTLELATCGKVYVVRRATGRVCAALHTRLDNYHSGCGAFVLLSSRQWSAAARR